MIFICTQYPAFRIYDSASDTVVQFQGGKLELEEDDPRYALVAAEALRNPAIIAVQNATTCPHCGEVFVGSAAKMQLGAHRKAVHFNEWLADKVGADAEETNTLVAGRAGFPCLDCPPGQQTFGTEADLALHARSFHATAPRLTESGETIGGDPDERGGGGAPVAAVPAAKASRARKK